MAVGSLKFREIDLGKKLGFERCEAKLWPIQLFHSIQCAIRNWRLRGMSHHHSSSSSCCNSWVQQSYGGSHIRGSKGMGLIPICKCGEVAVLRVARTLKNNGRQFWGCSKFKSAACSDNVWCNYFKWCDEEFCDERDGIIAQQRMKISELEISVRAMKKTNQFLLRLVIVVVVIFVVMLPIMFKIQCL